MKCVEPDFRFGASLSLDSSLKICLYLENSEFAVSLIFGTHVSKWDVFTYKILYLHRLVRRPKCYRECSVYRRSNQQQICQKRISSLPYLGSVSTSSTGGPLKQLGNPSLNIVHTVPDIPVSLLPICLQSFNKVAICRG